MKKITEKTPPRDDEESKVKFCLNCDDMDDLALSSEADDLAQLQDRFENCVHTGRFDGDVCSRLFVADDDLNASALSDDDDDTE
ncbi:MAG: hypothetical protein M5R41_02490 [Bacteroidia bacterium]|nr:hypothetical protein [Bacteroidia bacterium]